MKFDVIQFVKGVRRIVVYVSIISIVTSLALLNGCSESKRTTEIKAPIAVRVTRPVVRDMSEHVSYTGIVHAAEEVTVIASVQGTVVSLPLAEGNSVHLDDTLVVLSTPELEAVVTRLSADFSYWDEHFAADQRLALKGAVSQEQVDASRKAYASSKAALNEAESRLEKATEKAFFDGYILKHYVDIGQTVMPGQPLVRIGSKELEVHAEVVQENIGQNIKPGSIAIVHNNKAMQYQSKVLDVASATTGKSRTFTVTVSLPTTGSQPCRVGEAVVVDFITEISNQTLSIPTAAVLNRDTQPMIYLAVDNRAVQTPIKVGIQQSEYIAAEFEWNGHDNIVISNVTSLADGDLLYPVYVERW